MKGYPTEENTVGEHLKRRRIERGLKQSELADLLGVHRGSIQLWERGEGEPGIMQFPGIIRFLGYVPLRQTDRNGGLIAYLRQCAGLTQQELALAIGCNPGTIARWEAGKTGKIRPQACAIETLWMRMHALKIDSIIRSSVK